MPKKKAVNPKVETLAVTLPDCIRWAAKFGLLLDLRRLEGETTGGATQEALKVEASRLLAILEPLIPFRMGEEVTQFDLDVQQELMTITSGLRRFTTGESTQGAHQYIPPASKRVQELLGLDGTAKPARNPPRTTGATPANKRRNRDDFSAKIKRLLAECAGHRCSNPACGRATVARKSTKDGTSSIGVAAHITAAAPGGPRFDSSLNADARASYENAIWLCQTCQKLVDSDPQGYPAPLLRQWKEQREATQARERDGKPPEGGRAVLVLEPEWESQTEAWKSGYNVFARNRSDDTTAEGVVVELRLPEGLGLNNGHRKGSGWIKNGPDPKDLLALRIALPASINPGDKEFVGQLKARKGTPWGFPRQVFKVPYSISARQMKRTDAEFEADGGRLAENGK